MRYKHVTLDLDPGLTNFTFVTKFFCNIAYFSVYRTTSQVYYAFILQVEYLKPIIIEGVAGKDALHGIFFIESRIHCIFWLIWRQIKPTHTSYATHREDP